MLLHCTLLSDIECFPDGTTRLFNHFHSSRPTRVSEVMGGNKRQVSSSSRHVLSAGGGDVEKGDAAKREQRESRLGRRTEGDSHPG